MKSLVIVTKSPAPYRIRFYEETAKALRPLGWTVDLILAEGEAKDHPWKNQGRSSELRWQCAGHARKKTGIPGAGRWQWPTAELFKLLEQAAPDVVWTHESSPFCLGAALWARAGKRHCLLSTELGDHPPPYACGPAQRLIHKTTSGLYQSLIAHTVEATRRQISENIPVLLAPHAVSTAEYFPQEPEPGLPFRFLFTGSLDSRKGIERVVAAGRLLAASGHVFELRVLGAGPLAGWLASQPDPWISYQGFREGEALRQEYREASAYVLPTRGDTFAVTVHEAAASGLPLLVGKGAGAVETLVMEGLTGHSVDAEDVDQLASRMEALLVNPLASRRMGMVARELAARYDIVLLGGKAAEFINSVSGVGD